MSHTEERKEKICLNCQANLYGRYCHICGQENTEPRHSSWHLFTHFFYDLTHFDGNFFATLKDLILKPGFLSAEYMAGRRQRYLNPVRMYIFTSAIFFIVFFWVFNPKHMDTKSYKLTIASLEEKLHEALSRATNHEDSMKIQKAFEYVDPLAPADVSDTSNHKSGHAFVSRNNERQYRTIRQYDSIQSALPAQMRDGWLVRGIFHQAISMNLKYRNNSDSFMGEFLNTFFHSFPKLLFISLPLFALLLQLLYIRRRQFFYLDHGIFSIHLYIYSFIALLCYVALVNLENTTGWRWLWILNMGITLFSVVYAFRAMHNFYGQGILKTGLKFILLSIASFFMILFLFLFFGFYSILEL